MMRFLYLVMLFPTLAFSKAEVSCQNFGVVDYEAIEKAIPSFDDPRKELESTLSKLHRKYAEIEKGFRAESSAIHQDRMKFQKQDPASMLPGGYEAGLKSLEERWNQFNNKVMSVQKTVEEKKRCIGEEYEAAMTRLKKIRDEKVEEVRRRRHLTAVFIKSVVPSMDPSISVTEEVIALLKASQIPLHMNFKKCE